MTSFHSQSVTRAFIQYTLQSSAAIVAELESVLDIYPNRKPMLDDDELTRRQLTHDFSGPIGDGTARAIGSRVIRVGMYWDITGWQPSASQASLEALMVAVSDAMIGENMAGLSSSFSYKSRPFYISREYDSPQAVPVEITPESIWAPERTRYRVFVSPR